MSSLRSIGPPESFSTGQPPSFAETLFDVDFSAAVREDRCRQTIDLPGFTASDHGAALGRLLAFQGYVVSVILDSFDPRS